MKKIEKKKKKKRNTTNNKNNDGEIKLELIKIVIIFSMFYNNGI